MGTPSVPDCRTKSRHDIPTCRDTKPNAVLFSMNIFFRFFTYNDYKKKEKKKNFFLYIFLLNCKKNVQ